MGSRQHSLVLDPSSGPMYATRNSLKPENFEPIPALVNLFKSEKFLRSKCSKLQFSKYWFEKRCWGKKSWQQKSQLFFSFRSNFFLHCRRRLDLFWWHLMFTSRSATMEGWNRWSNEKWVEANPMKHLYACRKVTKLWWTEFYKIGPIWRRTKL